MLTDQEMEMTFEEFLTYKGLGNDKDAKQKYYDLWEKRRKEYWEFQYEHYAIIPECPECFSKRIAIRRSKQNPEILLFLCLDCNLSNRLPKLENFSKRANTTINNWSRRVINAHPFCTICGSKDELEAHHIIPVSNSESYKYIFTNGVCLCKKCHWLVHHKERGKESNAVDGTADP